MTIGRDRILLPPHGYTELSETGLAIGQRPIKPLYDSFISCPIVRLGMHLPFVTEVTYPDIFDEIIKSINLPLVFAPPAHFLRVTGDIIEVPQNNPRIVPMSPNPPQSVSVERYPRVHRVPIDPRNFHLCSPKAELDLSIHQVLTNVTKRDRHII